MEQSNHLSGLKRLCFEYCILMRYAVDYSYVMNSHDQKYLVAFKNLFR